VRHEYIQANGIRFHYVTDGEGPLVILMHGFPQCWYGWHKQIPALAKKFRVVAPDLRGYGETDKPKGARHYKLEILASDIVELIKALGEKKAHIVGHDWGGFVAWFVAANHPEVVDKLCILNIPHPAQMRKFLFTRPRQMLKSWYIFFFQLPWLPERMMLKPGTAEKMFRGMAVNKAAFTDEDIAIYEKAWQAPGAMNAAINWYRSAIRRPWVSPKHRIAAPKIVIWGEDDVALSKEMTYGQEKWVTGPYRIEYIKDCSHWVNEEQPESVNQLLLEHLS
jgi:pimeloyl-ACP methyl ester carboxylesterase